MNPCLIRNPQILHSGNTIGVDRKVALVVQDEWTPSVIAITTPIGVAWQLEIGLIRVLFQNRSLELKKKVRLIREDLPQTDKGTLLS